MRLNLGAGSDIRDGWVNVDIADVPGVDVVHDLDAVPWPFGDEQASEILAFDIFEHVTNPLGFMAECHRILAAGGLLTVRSPAAGTWCAATDPTHRRAVTENTFDFWVPGTDLHHASGAAYARNRHFAKTDTRREGDNIVFHLRKRTAT